MSNTVTVSPAAASKLVVTTQPPTSSAAGASFAVGVSIEDSFGNVVTSDNTDLVTLAIGTNPSSGTLSCTPGSTVTVNNGVASFSCSINKVGTGYTLSASSGALAGATTNAFNITPGPASHLVVTTQPPGSSVAGASFAVGISIEDSSGNVVTTDNSTAVTLAIGTNPASGTLTCTSPTVTAINGMASFSCSINKAGTGYTLGATSSPVLTAATTNAFNITAGAATQLSVSAPATATAGTPFSFTVTAQDAFGNIVTGYTGTVHFTSSDGIATLPTDYTFVAGDGGVHTFTSGATLKTAGNQTITATDTVTSSITGTSNTVAVSAAAATHFMVSAPTSVIAGTAFSFTVTASDAFGNTATGYTGIVHFTSSDGAATLPADATLTNGVGTFSATLRLPPAVRP